MRSIGLGTPIPEVLQRLKKMRSIRELEDTKKYRAAEFILDYISQLDPHVGIHCFRDPVYHHFSWDAMDEVFVKTCISKLFGIRGEEWLELIEEEVGIGFGCLVREAEIIDKRASGRNLCLGASEDLRPLLEARGHDVSCIEVDRACTPLDVLRREVKRCVLNGGEASRNWLRTSSKAN